MQTKQVTLGVEQVGSGGFYSAKWSKEGIFACDPPGLARPRDPCEPDGLGVPVVIVPDMTEVGRGPGEVELGLWLLPRLPPWWFSKFLFSRLDTDLG